MRIGMKAKQNLHRIYIAMGMAESLFYMDVITYPFYNPDADSDKISIRERGPVTRKYHYICVTVDSTHHSIMPFKWVCGSQKLHGIS